MRNCWVAMLVSLLTATNLFAHGGGTMALATLHISGHTVRYSIALSNATLPPALAESTPRALSDVVARHVRISAESEPCEAVPDTASVPALPGQERTIVLLYACARAPGALTIEDRLNEVLGAEHHTIATILFAGGSAQFIFQPDAQIARVNIASGASPDARHDAGGMLRTARSPLVSVGAALLALVGGAFLWRRRSRLQQPH